MPRLSHLVLTLCLAATSPLLAAPVPQVLTPKVPAPVRTTAPPDLLGRLWQHLTAVWGAEGCGMDPNGAKCSARTIMVPLIAVVPADAGCGMDPDGLCMRSR